MINKITISQYPIITHKLKEAGKSVSKRIADLELDKQIATTETVGALKKLRSELNNEFADLEKQRQAVKKGVSSPYLEFEELYKTEIESKYKSATNKLKDLIASHEDKIKLEKKENIQEYFNELCLSEKIDFILFEKLEIEINLSTSEKKYKEQVNEKIMKVVDDLALIKSTDYEAEILTEYKITLNASKAITTVKTRKESEKIESSRIKAAETQSRKNALFNLGLNYIEITNQYEFNDEIYVSLRDIVFLSKEEFIKKYAEIENSINDYKQSIISKENISTSHSVSPITKPVKIVVSAPISAPTIETPAEEIKTASFEVKGTLSKLRLLGEFMKTNNIIYKNI